MMTTSSYSQKEEEKHEQAEIVINEGALVSTKAIINSILPPGTAEKHNLKLKVVIQYGSIFHPGASLFIRLPLSSTENSTYVVIVGKNNVFDEACKVVIDLNAFIWKREHQQHKFQIIEEYNQFAPYSYVETGCIGSGNSFEASSTILCNSMIHRCSIPNGFVAAPKVQWNYNNILSHHINDDQEEKKSNEPYDWLEDRIFFYLDGKLQSRKFIHGKERNMRDLENKIPFMRHILRRYHKTLEVPK